MLEFIVPALVTLLVSYWVSKHLSRDSKGTIPSPPGIPFAGNALQIPSDHQWLKFAGWQAEYGDVFRLGVFSQKHLVLGSYEAARELLDIRGLRYSDRPQAVMAGELVGWSRGLGYAQGPPNPRFKQFRKLFHTFIGPLSTLSMSSSLERENARFLHRLMKDPENFDRHIRESASALILSVAYGYDFDEKRGDWLNLVKIAEEAMDGFSRASEPGRWWVDSLSFLRYIPTAVAPFKRVATHMRRDLERLYDVPYSYVIGQLAESKAKPSFVSSFISSLPHEPTPAEEELIKAAGASLYSGGAETTPSSLLTFLLAMVVFPDVQSKAQRIVDEYIAREGEHRLPHVSDRPRLSATGRLQHRAGQINSVEEKHGGLDYVEAVMKEVWRWNPSVPLGLAHVVSETDVYRDTTIDKGTIVWANIWSMLHNPSYFPSPDEFRPERYLDEHGKLRTDLKPEEDPTEIAFGFGRRICPGQHLAEDSVFLSLATMLYVFDVQGSVAKEEVVYDGFISFPRKFKCSIRVRDKAKGTLVEDIVGS